MNELWLFAGAGLIVAAAAAWMLRAYRRGDVAAKPGPALTVCAAVAVGALGLYLTLGKPAQADAPYAARLEALKLQNPATYTADEALAVLGAVAREQPNDPQPHRFMGDIYLQLGRPQEAARAYQAALQRDPALTPAAMGLGRAMVAIDQGVVAPEALALFQQAAQMAPQDPAPWLYQAMEAMQSGRQEDARRFWREAQARMAPDDPRRAMDAPMLQGQGQ